MAPSEDSATVGDLTKLGSKLQSLQHFEKLMRKDEDLTIFRRFDEVNMLNLLLLQDELETLTKEFKKTIPKTPERQTHASGGYLASYRLGQQALRVSEDASSGSEIKTAEAWDLLKKKLQEYNSALVKMAQIKGLDLPDMEDITKLQVARSRHIVDHSAALEDMSYWDESNNDDFVTLRSEATKSGRFNVGLKFLFAMFLWQVRDVKQAQTNVDSNGTVEIGQRNEHMSRAQRAKKFASTSRLAMALFGGIALIIPTVIMTKFEGTNISLITTSVSVVIFSLVMAFGATDSTGKDVLAATAAYTAVLVVFIGTSLAGTGSSDSPGVPA